MRARIYNEQLKEYYISEVYGIINRAGDWYIVDDIVDKGQLVLVEYLNFKTNPPYEVNIEIIDYNSISNEEWLNLSKDEMSTINRKIENGGKLHYFRGYRKIWEKQELLVGLLDGGEIDKKKFCMQNLSSKLEEWNYIEKGTFQIVKVSGSLLHFCYT